MQQITADVALLTDHRYKTSKAAPEDWYLGNILRDDQLLQNALNELGLSSVRVDWASPEVDWSKFGCAVFRTTWDYYERITEFSNWLDRVGQQIPLYNDLAIIRWNLDKHYLQDLRQRGIPVVSSRFIEPESTITLHQLIDETGWEEAVLKPCVSGGARHTYRVDRRNADEIYAAVKPLIAGEAFLFQPFMNDIQQLGEDTLMIIDGEFTHAVRKKPKVGDFRVQDDHGGTVHVCRATEEQIALAERAMAACPWNPLYGRVDLVRDHEGRWSVMELELIEPELWLREEPEAATRLARAIARDFQSAHE